MLAGSFRQYQIYANAGGFFLPVTGSAEQSYDNAGRLFMLVPVFAVCWQAFSACTRDTAMLAGLPCLCQGHGNAGRLSLQVPGR